MLTEDLIINKFKTSFPITDISIHGIGDDAAIIPINKKESYVISKDILVENIHFRFTYNNPQSIAHKALYSNLSDIAAMGATAKYIFVGIAIPKNIPAKWINAFSKYLIRHCKHNNIIILGGDTTAAKAALFISITIIGHSRNKHLKFRYNARPGDIIAVAGNLGYAHIGLTASETKKATSTIFKAAFLFPKAKILEGKWIGQQKGINAVMDISDGLNIDLSSLCNSSKVGANINLDSIALEAEFIKACVKLNLKPLHTKLTGGEDYSLLFTINPKYIGYITQQFKLTFGYNLTLIGSITSDKSVKYFQNGIHKKLKLTDFTHFGEMNEL